MFFLNTYFTTVVPKEQQHSALKREISQVIECSVVMYYFYSVKGIINVYEIFARFVPRTKCMVMLLKTPTLSLKSDLSVLASRCQCNFRK